jgi:hypothetical protein
MQSVAVSQVNRTHPDAPASLVTLIILLNLFGPKRSDIFGTLLLAKAHVDKEVAEIGTWNEARRGLVRCSTKFARDAVGKWLDGVPAA